MFMCVFPTAIHYHGIRYTATLSIFAACYVSVFTGAVLDGYIITTSIFVAGMLSDLFACLSERLTIVNLMTVFSGNPQPLQSLWAPLQHFVNAYVLRGEPPTVENIDRAVTRIIDDMRDDLHATCVSLSRIRPASLLS